MIRGRTLCFFVYFHLVFAKSKTRFEVELESAEICRNVNPPFPKKLTVLSKYNITVVNGHKYLSGYTTIVAPTALKNFSAKSFTIDDHGKRDVVFQITEASCRNIVAKAIIMFGKVSINMRNCMMPKGTYDFENLDFNRISHALPGWQRPGPVVHELRMGSAVATDFCNEMTVNIRILK